ncbi:MAG: hypothetical protein PHF14_11535 [Verrucomicrobiota bacterium]|jgi:S-methylmethionine-dependent homocysteine/selenocysteine methylase|nr:hypothetical protein [Verrucomicrobiota bacterium]MDD8047085.1 hypothetical protein [Verrucomicrobiota bacterium]MDD8050839.1 hypothetical protein [Verrucomicrobiota bacterium]MDI9385581.1 hypothetical protein [Verrucomicrobiota bacterium]
MMQRSDVGSVEALAQLRNSLILFRERAKVLLDEANMEVGKTRGWVEDDRRQHWTAELRARNRKLELARQEWFNARMGEVATAPFYQAKVNRAQAAVDEAEAKLRAVKRWSRQFDTFAAPHLKKPAQARAAIETDIPRAVGFLAELIEILGGYVAGAGEGTGGTVDSDPGSDESPGDPTD